MKKILLFTQLAFWSNLAFADRYGISDGYGGGGASIFDVLGLIAATIFAFWFLISSYDEWKERQETGEKVERSGSLPDGLWTIVGYSLVSFFISFPLVMLSGFIGLSDSLMNTWLTIGFICFAGVAFLRQT